MPKVLSIGILVADLVGKPIDGMPAKGELEFLDQLEIHTGGCAVNTGITLARLGVDTEVMGKVGRDALGDYIIAQLDREKIRTENILRGEKNTSATMVMVSGDGERSFFHYIGANGELLEQDVKMEAVERADWVHIGGAFVMPKFDGVPTKKVLKKAKSLDKITSLDTAGKNGGRWLEILSPSLPYIDYFLPSIEEAREITGLQSPTDIADFLLQKGVGTVALKRGERGCYVKNQQKEEIRLPSLKVKVKDTTGAGDAYAGGFIAGILKGYDIESSARIANLVAASCVGELGATRGIKSWSETLQDLYQYYPDFDFNLKGSS